MLGLGVVLRGSGNQENHLVGNCNGVLPRRIEADLIHTRAVDNNFIDFPNTYEDTVLTFEDRCNWHVHFQMVAARQWVRSMVPVGILCENSRYLGCPCQLLAQLKNIKICVVSNHGA